MIESRLSRRYAKALFNLACEENREEAVASELQRFVDAYSGTDLHKVLNNPAFGADKRKSLALRIANLLEAATLVVRFLSLLIDHDRFAILPSIAQQYRRLLDDAKGRVQARVATAAPLGEDKKNHLGRALKDICKKDVILHEEIRPELIGGLSIELEGRIYDGTISARLRGMRDRIERG